MQRKKKFSLICAQKENVSFIYAQDKNRFH